MKMKKISCPYCGGIIDTELKGREFVFCSYCGQQIHIDDGKIEITINKNININQNIHKRYTDDAEILREKNKEKENKRGWIILIVCLIFLFGLPAGIYGGLEINERIAMSKGELSAGFYRDLIGEDVSVVEAHFEAAGFTNIQLIDLDDSGILFFRNGKVETISVNGDTSFESTDYFPPDSKVVISYH